MLSLSSEDYFLEEADSNIQANLEDADVQKALKSGVDLLGFPFHGLLGLLFISYSLTT